MADPLPSSPPSGDLGRRARVAERMAFGLLSVALLWQITGYHVMRDVNPDGYVSYARHLQDSWSLLPDFARLPGYPLFLAAVDKISPFDLAEDCFLAQMFIALPFFFLLWREVRRAFGALVGLVFWALLSFRNFLVYYSEIMLADFLMVVLCMIAFALMRSYVRGRTAFDLPRLAALLACFFVTYAVHPASRLILGLFLLGFAVSSTVLRCWKKTAVPRGEAGWRRTGIRVALIALVLVASTSLSARLLDRGNAKYNLEWIGVRVVMCLPPATERPKDLQIERLKQRASERLGYRLDLAPPVFMDELAKAYPIPPRLWKARLAAHPLQYIACGLREILFKHHIIVKQFFPFDSEIRFVTPEYLPVTGSARSNIFRTTGIELRHYEDSTTSFLLAWPAVYEAFRILVFHGLLIVGGLSAFRARPVATLTVAFAMVGWVLVVALIGLPLEPRYLLVFAPFLYAAQALGVARVVVCITGPAYSATDEATRT